MVRHHERDCMAGSGVAQSRGITRLRQQCWSIRWSRRETRPAIGEVVLPPQPGSIEIDYTALSLAIPERVLFRYRLDGVDKQWQSAGTRRQAFFIPNFVQGAISSG